MSEHHAHIAWKRTSADFTYESYNRIHEWRFASATVSASAAKEFRGEATGVNPEEAFVAALSSCHMLTFLAIAARKRLTVDTYDDEAVGLLERNAAGKLVITRVTLRPKVIWHEGVNVTKEELDRLHRHSHEECFIANSVKTDVNVEAQI